MPSPMTTTMAWIPNETLESHMTYAGRDTAIETLFYTPLKGRTGLTIDQFRRYWKDAHGPLCARLPGLYQYKQFHLLPDRGGVWPAPDGVDRHTPDDEQDRRESPSSPSPPRTTVRPGLMRGFHS